MRVVKIMFLTMSSMMVACSTTKEELAYTPIDKVAVERPTKDRAQTLTDLGLAYYRLEKYTYALGYLKQSLALDANNATTYQVMALIKMRSKLPEQAELSFVKALAIAPDNFDIVTDYAVFLYTQKRYKEAISTFNRIVKAPFYKRKWVAYTYLGLHDLKNKQKVKAEKKFYYALKINKNYAPALLEMARSRYGRGELMSARAFIERYFSNARKTVDSLRLAIKIENALQEYDMAEQYRLELKHSFPYAGEA